MGTPPTGGSDAADRALAAADAPTDPGVAGNERLTAAAGAVLLV